MTQPNFLYFDLGIVLVDFSIERMLQQLSDASGADTALIEDVVFGNGLQEKSERGQVSGREFYDVFCRKTGTNPDYETLRQAGSDIFELNLSMLPVVTQLRQAGYRMGILSNTCESHWEHCRGRYRIIEEDFEIHALSFRIGAAKPETEIFRTAVELAGVTPGEVFFVDDLADNVAGANAAGFDAVQYTTTPRLVADLWERGIRFNY